MTRATAGSGESRSAEPLWSELVRDQPLPTADPARPHLLGALPGEGVGSEVTGAALAVLDALKDKSAARFETRIGGDVGFHAEAREGAPLSW